MNKLDGFIIFTALIVGSILLGQRFIVFIENKLKNITLKPPIIKLSVCGDNDKGYHLCKCNHTDISNQSDTKNLNNINEKENFMNTNSDNDKLSDKQNSNKNVLLIGANYDNYNNSVAPWNINYSITGAIPFTKTLSKPSIPVALNTFFN